MNESPSSWEEPEGATTAAHTSPSADLLLFSILTQKTVFVNANKPVKSRRIITILQQELEHTELLVKPGAHWAPLTD